KPFIFSRVGFSGTFEGDGYEVLTITAGGPAEKAGLKKGDVLTMLDGQVAKELGLSGSREIFRRAPGTRLQATVRTATGATRMVVIILQDVL
ncbi:PDZ domain-containing protein, partial [Armatimonas sp.]|uniref:PDZ domain-containing protein n=1 Tax=Armatimonas sp. TaxID=1872638 RepID=UPI00286C814E